MNLSRSQRSASSSKKLGSRKSPSATASGTEKSARKGAAKAAILQPSAEQVALRAYFIAERRRSLGMHGDETSDWIAAEEELRAELKSN